MTKIGELLGGGNETRQQMEKVLELEGELAKVNNLNNYCVNIGEMTLGWRTVNKLA